MFKCYRSKKIQHDELGREKKNFAPTVPALSCCFSLGRSCAGLTKVSFPKHSATRFLVPSSWLSQCWNSKAQIDSTWGERLEAGHALSREREKKLQQRYLKASRDKTCLAYKTFDIKYIYMNTHLMTSLREWSSRYCLRGWAEISFSMKGRNSFRLPTAMPPKAQDAAVFIWEHRRDDASMTVKIICVGIFLQQQAVALRRNRDEVVQWEFFFFLFSVFTEYVSSTSIQWLWNIFLFFLFFCFMPVWKSYQAYIFYYLCPTSSLVEEKASKMTPWTSLLPARPPLLPTSPRHNRDSTRADSGELEFFTWGKREVSFNKTNTEDYIVKNQWYHVSQK